MGKELHIVIPSSTEFVGPIMSFCYALFKDKALNESQVSNVVTAVIEAIANAINHGNRGDVRKNIEVALTVQANTLSVAIQDEGPGFNPADLPDPLSPENLLKPGGRGIFLIKSFMDRVDFEFTDHGTCLRMQKAFDHPIE
jgi:serine/threonine-protein kinase RsbW